MTTKAQEAEMIARHKVGCELARNGADLPPDAPLETRAGYYGELQRIAEHARWLKGENGLGDMHQSFSGRVQVKPYMWRGTLNGV